MTRSKHATAIHDMNQYGMWKSLLSVSYKQKHQFWPSVGVKIGVKYTAIRFILPKKVRKTAVFLAKTAVFVVAEAGLEPTTSGLWAAVYITFSENNRQFEAFLRCLPPPTIHRNLPRPLRDDPVWVKTWVRLFSLTRSRIIIPTQAVVIVP